MRTYNKKDCKKQKKSTKKKLNRLDDLERIAVELDAICRQRLADGAIHGGILAGMEPAIRQQALIKLIGGFLQKNADYIKARKSGDKGAVHNAMRRCAAIAMAYSKAEIAVELSCHLYRETPVDENNGGFCLHPSLVKPSDLPANVKASMVMISVNQAVREGSLSVANASIVAMVCDKGLPVSEVAELVRIEPSAVYQQLRRVKLVLPEMMARVEVPWNF